MDKDTAFTRNTAEVDALLKAAVGIVGGRGEPAQASEVLHLLMIALITAIIRVSKPTHLRQMLSLFAGKMADEFKIAIASHDESIKKVAQDAAGGVQ